MKFPKRNEMQNFIGRACEVEFHMVKSYKRKSLNITQRGYEKIRVSYIKGKKKVGTITGFGHGYAGKIIIKTGDFGETWKEPVNKDRINFILVRFNPWEKEVKILPTHCTLLSSNNLSEGIK